MHRQEAFRPEEGGTSEASDGRSFFTPSVSYADSSLYEGAFGLCFLISPINYNLFFIPTYFIKNDTFRN